MMFGLELRRRLIVAASVFFSWSRRIGATDLRKAERNGVASLPRDGVAEAFHQLVENLDFVVMLVFSRREARP
jgi:hypothetical protein